MKFSKVFITNTKWTKLSINLYLIQLLIELNNSLSINAPIFKRYANYIWLVTDLINYLDENLDQKFYLDDLEVRYRLNGRYLNRIFKGTTGLAIFQYQQKLKVEKAKKLLQSLNLPITDIALTLGFESSQYFSYFFKKSTGLTPTQFRMLSNTTTSN
jgi:AraC-like DNA-binding protein